MKKKVIGLLLAMSMTASMLAGCGSDGGSQTSGDGGQQSSESDSQSQADSQEESGG